MSVRQNGKTIAGSNKYLPDLFDYKTTDYLLKNPSWLRADTFSWHNGDIYIPAYNQLVREANDFTDIVSETVNGITISFTLNENGHKIVNGQDSENVAKVNEIYEQTGCSWYYILDIVNKRFKLPRELTRDRDAKLIRSEDNGTTWYRLYDDGWVEQGGLIPLTSTGWKDNLVITLPITMMNDKYNINFMNGYTDYIDHDTVVTARTTTNFTTRRYVSYQSEACWEVKGYSAQTYKSPKTRYLYFYVGPFTQLDIINDPDVIEILNHKADIDLENILSNIDYVVDSQLPTAENDYTWYRKYKSGWVEQGGIFVTNNNTAGFETTINLPVAMSNSNYTATVGVFDTANDNAVYLLVCNKTTNTITLKSNLTAAGAAGQQSWRIEGMAA